MKTKVLLLAAATIAGLSAGAAPSPAQPVVTHQVQPPPKPTPPAAPSTPAPRNEIERAARLLDDVPRRGKHQWDGKNRNSGDRAHKRLKHRRSAGK